MIFFSRMAISALLIAAVCMMVSAADESAVQNKQLKSKSVCDTLVVSARLVEIPGKFPPNDLYNYVYIMKFKIAAIEKGSCETREILAGVYNPLIPRNQIKDAMVGKARGNATKFAPGESYRLTLIKPIDKIWTEAVEDEYVDSDLDKYYAIQTDIIR